LVIFSKKTISSIIITRHWLLASAQFIEWRHRISSVFSEFTTATVAKKCESGRLILFFFELPPSISGKTATSVA
jgi:hypothetical protein